MLCCWTIARYNSLSDGWGLLLQDRVLRQQGIAPTQLRLVFVGQRGMSAPAFEPGSDAAPVQSDNEHLATLWLKVQVVFDGQTEDVMSALVAAGSSDGATFMPPRSPSALSVVEINSCRYRFMARKLRAEVQCDSLDCTTEKL